jgi:hypothetical protein
MEKMERYRFIVGAIVFAAALVFLPVLLRGPSPKRPRLTLDELVNRAVTKKPVPSFEELVGPTAQKNPDLPSLEELVEGLPTLEELVEGLPTLEELLASDPQLLAEREGPKQQADAGRWQLRSARSWPQVFQQKSLPPHSEYEDTENPLQDYFAKQRLHQQQREAEPYRINRMNTMAGIESDLQVGHEFQQGDYQVNRFNPTPPHLGAFRINKYHPDSLANPYGAGSPYKPDGLMNPYSQYGSPYSNKSWRNPYATDAPKLVDSQGNYRGRLSTNPYQSDSISNPYGRYGSPYSSESINNPYGAGNPYSQRPIYVVPSR